MGIAIEENNRRTPQWFRGWRKYQITAQRKGKGHSAFWGDVPAIVTDMVADGVCIDSPSQDLSG